MGLAVILGSLSLIAQAPAQGSPTAKPSTLPEFVASAGYQANIARLFAAIPADVFQHCAALVSTGSQTTVIKPASFNDKGFPVSGAWRQSFPVSGCGNDTTFNFFFTAQPDGKILSMTAAPGNTHADFALQRNAVQYVRIAAQLLAKDCSAMHLRNTSYDGPTAAQRQPAGGKPVGESWRETWSLSACGQVINVPVTFTPDATGTTIVSGVAKLALN